MPRALPPPARWIGTLGYLTLYVVGSLGRFGRFLGHAAALVFIPPLKMGRLAGRIYFIGFKSLIIVILTGAFTGMALGLQVFLTLQRVGSEAFVGTAVGISSCASSAPCSLRSLSRAGRLRPHRRARHRASPSRSDALMVMALNPMRYLVVPAMLAGVITFPMLTAIFDVAASARLSRRHPLDVARHLLGPDAGLHRHDRRHGGF
jgi:phospholipid/cholesterol/gamma-HCH transport system permease protein